MDKPEQTTQSAKACGTGCLALLFFCIVLPLSCSIFSGGSTSDGFVQASSNLWAGEKLYYGERRTYAFEILGGNDNYTDPVSGATFRGLKVRYPSGSEEWKDRDYIVSSKIYWIKEDDPALQAQRWQVYNQ